MKAVQIYEFGGSEQLKVEEIEMPKLKAQEVLVGVKEAGVNPIDYKIREGMMPNLALPRIMGQDFAGVILEIGPEVTTFQKGDPVLGFANGTYAEYISVNIENITKMPEGMDFEIAASLPTAGLTAYQIVADEAKIDDGHRVLIHGAAGGVGSFALQLAKSRGAYVIANASKNDESYLKRLGADEVIDHHTERFEEKAKDVDVVIDLVGGSTFERSFDVVREGGTVVTTVEISEEKRIQRDNIKLIQTLMKRDSNKLGEFVNLVVDGTIEVKLNEIVPLEEVIKAHEDLQGKHHQGKIVLMVNAA